MNHGFNLQLEREHQKGDEWVFGSTNLKCIAEYIPEDKRVEYLPLGEIQRGIEDMMDCATRGPINILETKFNYLIRNKLLSFDLEYWLRENGYFDGNNITFSDAFIAIKSGTNKQGNSMKATLEAIRKCGLIPKKMLPLEVWMDWEHYHNPERITEEMENLGWEFLKRLTINYEKVYEPDFSKLLIKDMLNVAGYAWSEPINGEYPKIDRDPNHVFVDVKRPQHYIFDNYPDSYDGDFFKKLAPDYKLMDYGYRILINGEKAKKGFWDFIIKFMRELFK